LLKHTWAEHPDKKNLQEALDEIRKCAMSLNETKKKHSTKKKVAEFQDKFKKPDELEVFPSFLLSFFFFFFFFW